MARKGLSAALCELHKNLHPNLPHLTETGGSRPQNRTAPAGYFTTISTCDSIASGSFQDMNNFDIIYAQNTEKTG